VAIYLIHFERPYRHANHYLGFVDTSRHPLEEALESRLAFHRSGRGSRLLRAVNAAGIGWSVVRVWEEGTRTDERRLKGRSSTRLCPICNEGWQARGQLSNVTLLVQAGTTEDEGLVSRGAFSEREADHGSALFAQRRAG
jgi:hypothetical protein